MIEEGNYKGFKWRLIYAGYDIFGMHSFQPYAGNYLLNIPQEERDKKLKAKIRYEINKQLKVKDELKGGIKE